MPPALRCLARPTRIAVRQGETCFATLASFDSKVVPFVDTICNLIAYGAIRSCLDISFERSESILHGVFVVSSRPLLRLKQNQRRKGESHLVLLTQSLNVLPWYV